MTLGGMAPVLPSSETKLAEPVARTPPPLPGAVKYVMSDQLDWPGTGEWASTSALLRAGERGHVAVVLAEDRLGEGVAVVEVAAVVEPR